MRPKQYISYSQLALYEASPTKYKAQYLEGAPGYSNSGMRYGSKVADALENQELTGDILTDILIANMPKYELKDILEEVDIKIGKHTVPLVIRVDSRTRSGKAIYEYKTGKTKWTQAKVDKNDQITIYILGLCEKYGHKPQDIKAELVWTPTQDGPDGIEPTGEILRFKTTRNTIDLLKMKARLLKAWDGIEELTKETWL